MSGSAERDYRKTFVPVKPGERTPKMVRNTTDYQVLLRTIWAEARGEPADGQLAVAHVIWTRARSNLEYWGGNTIAGVCLKKYQFECWNEACNIDDINMIGSPEGILAKEAIENWLDNFKNFRDPVKLGMDPKNPLRDSYADHYNNPTLENNPVPKWVGNCYELCKIENHQFYVSKDRWNVTPSEP
ncbi:hypothetical protein RvY_18552 [Ramazzottius varieornatus]|uniref:Cell wall hydrolase SleB domain-containing protein n=1 Tax=Ramazzottius varieornatus TaxID=947166 RepID=A0A1D1WAM1_RAMVA|nr:hypothetical protein RvY_18552 [Ramazzottius varieornatus]